MKNERCEILDDGKKSFNSLFSLPTISPSVSFRSRYGVYRIRRWRVDVHVTLGERAVGRQARVRAETGVYVHFHFVASPAFHPRRWHGSCKSFDEFADGIGEAIKAGDDGTSFGKGKSKKGLHACK